MPTQKVLLLERSESSWRELLEEYFEDTCTSVSVYEKAADLKPQLASGEAPVVFLNLSLLSPALAQALQVCRQVNPDTRIFVLGKNPAVENNLHPDHTFPEMLSLSEFQKELIRRLPLPEKIRLLVVDNEIEIGRMIQDFFERRVEPSFEVRYAVNGQEALDKVGEQVPDVMILDIKMPIKDGRDVYRELHEKNIQIPTIVFFDAISSEELAEIRRYGKPAVVEKGAPASTMPELMEMVKKVRFFS